MQDKIQSTGEELLKKMENQSKISLFSKDYWYGSIMDWSMRNDQFKTKMFRFVDVLPSLGSGSEVARHLKEYFAEGGEKLPSIFNVGLGLGSLAPSLMAGTIRKNVTEMAKMFITGENPSEAMTVIKKSRKNKITFTVDLLGEATLSEQEAQDYQKRYLEMMDWLSKEAQTWEEIPLIDSNHEGSIPKVNVSVKMTALYSQLNDKAWEHTKTELKNRLRPLFQKAAEKNIFLTLDMEQYSVKNLTVEVFKELLLEPHLKNYKFFGCVIQTYLRDSFLDLQNLSKFSQTRGTPFSIRLVKGAYWDYETVEAEQRRWPTPVFTNKKESDAQFELCASYILENYKHLHLALASHNVRSISAALVKAESLGLPKSALEIQMLYGMAEPIKKTLVDMGYRIREYAPIGELIPGMAYLVRRLLENTSNESWLRGKFAENLSVSELLKNPSENLERTSAEPKTKTGIFYNEPLLDFAIASNRETLQKTLSLSRAQLREQSHWPIIEGKEIKNEQTKKDQRLQMNPSQKEEILGKIGMAGVEEAEAAVKASLNAYSSWKKISYLERADKIDKVAHLMKRDRFKLITTQILEVGKPWAEADGDVTEAIDFCHYYAQHIREIGKGQKVGNAPGEHSLYHYQARGVTLVIAPWNFPLAILTGMTVAALVTGNTVIMKPAEQSSLVAADLMRLLLEAQIPAGAVSFLPGLGEVVGAHLVKHPAIANIAFTGSKAVGLHILREAQIIREGQKHVKRCIIEMGGKNALIIDNDADLDEAVKGSLYSAFGFSGQKCSAASRLIVLEEVYEKFVHRLVEAAKSMTVCAAENPLANMGPVIDEEAQQRILRTIEEAKKTHHLLFEGKVPEGGYYVPPTIFGEVSPESKLAHEEIFGPVIAIIKVKSISEAFEVANNTEYALTGGIFTRSPATIERAKVEFECGNLYINRTITGAMVDRHPFGGFKMSGIGSKTGGPDYLKQFMEPRCVTENTLRRGFAPTE